MAEEGTRTAGLDSGEHPGFPWRVRVADGVHTAVDPMKPAALDPSSDRAFAQAARSKIGDRRNPLLLAGQRHSAPIRVRVDL